MAGLFSKNQDVRMAVLEQKFDAFEDLSAKMLSKLETAVDKISETNHNISEMLIRHEERLDKTVQTDSAIIKILDEVKESKKEEKEAIDAELYSLSQIHASSRKELEQSIETTNRKVDELAKFRWILAGGLIVFTFLVNEFKLLDGLKQVPAPSSSPPPPPEYRYAPRSAKPVDPYL